MRRFFLFSCLCLLPIIGAEPRKALVDQESIHELHGVPADYRFSGEYDIKQRTKVSAGELLETPIAPLRYHVFTNGEEVRLYLASLPKEFSAFEVYRADGIQVILEQGRISELVPGVQALRTQGDKFRHLCLTKEFFQLTTFLGNSDQVELIRAHRVDKP